MPLVHTDSYRYDKHRDRENKPADNIFQVGKAHKKRCTCMSKVDVPCLGMI